MTIFIVVVLPWTRCHMKHEITMVGKPSLAVGAPGGRHLHQ
jgi:hypothetical protein